MTKSSTKKAEVGESAQRTDTEDNNPKLKNSGIFFSTFRGNDHLTLHRHILSVDPFILGHPVDPTQVSFLSMVMIIRHNTQGLPKICPAILIRDSQG